MEWWPSSASFDDYIKIVYKSLMEMHWTMEQLMRDLGRLGRLMIQLAGPDLTRTESALLGAVSERPRRITELARFVGLTQPGVTTMVTSLERRGLARREPDPGDGRAVRIQLTERGRALIEERHRRVADALIASLSEQRVDAEQLVADAAAAIGVLLQALEPPPVTSQS
jgi:DNA-binding MarR family transcriptional regulator